MRGTQSRLFAPRLAKLHTHVSGPTTCIDSSACFGRGADSEAPADLKFSRLAWHPLLRARLSPRELQPSAVRESKVKTFPRGRRCHLDQCLRFQHRSRKCQDLTNNASCQECQSFTQKGLPPTGSIPQSKRNGSPTWPSRVGQNQSTERGQGNPEELKLMGPAISAMYPVCETGLLEVLWKH